MGILVIWSLLNHTVCNVLSKKYSSFLSLLHMLSPHSIKNPLTTHQAKTNSLSSSFCVPPLSLYSLSLSHWITKSKHWITTHLFIILLICSVSLSEQEFPTHFFLLLFPLFHSWLLTPEFSQTKTATTTSKTVRLTEWKSKQPLPKLWSLELFMLLWFKEAALQILGSHLLLLQLTHAMLLTSLLRTTLFSRL